MDSRRISDEYFDDCPNTRLTERRKGILNTVKPESRSNSKIYCNYCLDITSLTYCDTCMGYFCDQCYIFGKKTCINCNKRSPEYVSIKYGRSIFYRFYRCICCYKID